MEEKRERRHHGMHTGRERKKRDGLMYKRREMELNKGEGTLWDVQKERDGERR